MLRTPGRGHNDRYWFVLGGLLGGTTIGLALGLLISLVPRLTGLQLVRVLLIAILAIGAVLVDIRRLSRRLPQNRRQVRQSVVFDEHRTAAFMFGFELGTGARTYVTAAAPYLGAMALIATGAEFWSALAVGASFGFSRGAVGIDQLVSNDDERWYAVIEGLTNTRPILPVTANVLVAVSAITFVVVR